MTARRDGARRGDGDEAMETMAEWIDRQPWPPYVKIQAHQMGDNSSMSRALWQAWLDTYHNGLLLAARTDNQ